MKYVTFEHLSMGLVE